MWYFVRICVHARSWREFAKCRFAHFPSFFSVHVDTYGLLKLSNGWTDWQQIWHTCADSSGNGYSPNKLPFEKLGVLGVQTFKSLEKLLNGLIDWHQLWFTSADSSGNGHYAKYKSPHYTPGGNLGGHKFKCVRKLSNCLIDWHQLWFIIIIIIKHLLSAIHPGKNLLGGAEQDIQYIKISNYTQKLRTLLNN